MKVQTETLWLYWWRCRTLGPGGHFVRSTYSSRKKTSKEVTAYDRENGWKVGRVYRQRVTMKAEVLK